MRLTIPSLLALGLFLGSCAVPPTQVVVRLATNLAAPRDFDSIALLVLDDDGGVVRNQPIYDITVPPDGAFHEIGSFGVIPRGADSSRRFEVRATAMLAGTELFQSRVISSFVSRQTILLDLYLPGHCLALAATCQPDETCGIAGCVSPEVDPTALPVYQNDSTVPPEPSDPRPAPSYILSGGAGPEARVPREVTYTIDTARPATIHYTLDGSEPAVDGPTTMSAASPVALPPLGDATIRWFSVSEDGTPEATSHTFTSILDVAVQTGLGSVVENVDIAGSGPVAEVAPGAMTSVSLNWQMWRGAFGEYCSTSTTCCIIQFSIAVDAVGKVHCEDDAVGLAWPRWGPYPGDDTTLGVCGSTTLPLGYDAAAPLSFSFTAPTEIGRYAMRVTTPQQNSCAEIGGGTDGRVIGYVVVR